jgi:capsular polysaccharide biosynthesis protein
VTTTLAEYGRLLWSRWRWLMWGVLLALAAATAVLILSPPLYRSEATVFVRTPGDVSRVQDGGDSYAQARAGTYSALAESTSLAARVIADLGLDLKPETLSGRVQAIHDSGTALMNVAVSAPSGAEAQRTATVLLNELSTTVRSLESVPGSLAARAELVVVDPPSQPARMVAWGVPISLVLPGAALLGLVLGAVGAVLRSLNEHPMSDPVNEDNTPATELLSPSASATSDVLVGSDGTIDAAPIAPGRARHRAARQMLTNGNERDA